MKVYSYVVARDYGFAPNPFFGVCTLATCKPRIRGVTRMGDWVIGTGSKSYDLGSHLVFAMRVTEILSYDQYWADPRFRAKRPMLRGSVKQAYGDNIYHHGRDGQWIQENSHHSLPGGRKNLANVRHDTQTSSVLIATDFVYWGSSGPMIPRRLRALCSHRGHKCNFPPEFAADVISWVRGLGVSGYAGAPAEFNV